MATKTRSKTRTRKTSTVAVPTNGHSTAITVRDSDAPIVTDAHTSKHQPKTWVISPGLAYNGSRNRGSFKGPDYNLHDVANALDKEPLFRRSVDKLRTLVWKNGFSFVGRNPQAVKYVRERFRQIAMVSGIPTKQLFRDMVDQLVTYHNAFVAKVRKPEASGGLRYTTFDGRELDPVAAYYPLCATTIRIDKETNGRVRKYQQVVPGYAESQWPEFRPDDMIHVYKDRKVGLSTGTPYVIPVLDDIRALRAMEENVERLVYQHAVPLYQYIVGTEKMPARPDEIDEIQEKIERMPVNGGIATPERHAIKVIGAEGEALDASHYLEYFLNRVRGGLHLSSVDWGEGDSSSRGTSLTMSQDTRDTVEEYQDVIKTFVDAFMIDELLIEGGFHYDEYNPANKVELFIPEIDIDARIKAENHAMTLFQGNMVTEGEARVEIGKEPMKTGDRKETYFELVTLPSIEAKAAQAALSPGTSNRDMPANQHGKQLVRPTVTKATADAPLALEDAYASSRLVHLGFHHAHTMAEESWTRFRRELVDMLLHPNALQPLWESGLQQSFVDQVTSQVGPMLLLAYRTGFDSVLAHSVEVTEVQQRLVQADAGYTISQWRGGMAHLARDAWSHALDVAPDDRTKAAYDARLDALAHRVPMNLATGLMRSYNFGRARSYAVQGHPELLIPGCCDQPGSVVDIRAGIVYESLPPIASHPNCICQPELPPPS